MKSLPCFFAILALSFLACDKDEARPAGGMTLESLAGQEVAAIDFLTQDYGVACGILGTLLKTENGGETWQTLAPGTESSLLSVFVLDHDRFYTSRNGLYATDNGGITFHQLGDFESGGGSIFDIHFFDEREGVIVQAGTIYKTYDAGATWRATYSPSSFASMFAVTTNRTIYFAGGRTYDAVHEGELHKSTDNGDTWVQINLPDSMANSEIMAVSFVTDRTGYVATFDQKVYRTDDGAATWEALTSVGDGLILDINFKDASEGHLISGSQIFVTKDGGRRWSVEETATEDLFDLDRTPDGTLYVVGRSGTFLRIPARM